MMVSSSILMPILALLLLNVSLAQSKAQLGDVDPCRPSPCGRNTECSVNSVGAAICRCLPGNYPKPDTITGCGPQCTQDYECRSNQRCLSNQCQDPCQPNPCGQNAECESVNHRAVCRCFRGFIGDSLARCNQQTPIARAIISQPPPQAVRAHDPCNPSPCGQNAQCRASLDRPVCTCLPGHQGNPLISCRRGECSSNSECPSFKVCEDFNCVNPCTRACGANAQCDVRNRIAVCTCPAGYTGDATTNCRRYDPNELCYPSPCGQNTKCRVENNRPICSCQPTFIGDPLSGCRHECETSNDCPSQQSCQDFKCKNPCINLCGKYATCEVRNHQPVCKCPEDYLGDPYTNCFPECTTHAECPANRACIGLKCGDPCKDQCGINADCRVDKANHKAICSCPKGYTGHPFERCTKQTPADLCSPNPCGQNAVCNPGYDNTGRDRPVCTCPAGYIGDALINCRRGECQSDSECSNNRICTNYNCKDPCEGACGVNARCDARNHGAVCSCPSGYRDELCYPSPCGQNTKCRVENNRPICSCQPTFIGDPLSGCRHECETSNDCPSQQSCQDFKCKNPCINLCGKYATCEVRNHQPVCKCPEDYLGDPYTNCFPECTTHAECPANRACIGLKCGDPCKDQCGINADCRVDKANHKAICSCPKGYTGHPFERCTKQTPADLCSPNPCGQNAVCNPGYDNTGRDRPVCTCPAGYIGDALINCRRGECQSDSECSNNRICTNYNCKDPCEGACGVNARCDARNHGAVCSCPSGYRGDPFSQCFLDPVRAKRKTDKKAEAEVAAENRSADKEAELSEA